MAAHVNDCHYRYPPNEGWNYNICYSGVMERKQLSFESRFYDTDGDGDKFLKDFIEYSVPEDILACVTFNEPTKGFWIQPEFDCQKLSALQVFALLCLFRYPHEHPTVTRSYLQLREDNPNVSRDLLFVTAQKSIANSNHGFICTYHFDTLSAQDLKAYRFKNKWPKLGQHVSMFESHQYRGLFSTFSPRKLSVELWDAPAKNFFKYMEEILKESKECESSTSAISMVSPPPVSSNRGEQRQSAQWA